MSLVGAYAFALLRALLGRAFGWRHRRAILGASAENKKPDSKRTGSYTQRAAATTGYSNTQSNTASCNNTHSSRTMMISKAMRTHLVDGHYIRLPSNLHVAEPGVLGQGSYGVVIAATDTACSKNYAVKTMNLRWEELAESKRIIREVLIYRALRRMGGHECICNAYHVMPGSAASSLNDISIVLCREQYDLKTLLRDPRVSMSPEAVCAIAYKMLRGLAFLHSAGIMHRDIKPANILVSNPDTVKICDFGLARTCEVPDNSALTPIHDRHKTASFCATDLARNALQAQEYIRNQEASEASTARPLHSPNASGGRKGTTDATAASDSDAGAGQRLMLTGLPAPAPSNGNPGSIARRQPAAATAKPEAGEYSDHVVSLWYRAPEIIITHTQYTEAIDMWSAGCVLAELLRKAMNKGAVLPLFPADRDSRQLAYIFSILGSPHPRDLTHLSPRNCRKVIRRHGCTTQPEGSQFMLRRFNELFAGVQDSRAMEMLESLLQINPERRMTAMACVAHPYFASADDYKGLTDQPAILPRPEDQRAPAVADLSALETATASIDAYMLILREAMQDFQREPPKRRDRASLQADAASALGATSTISNSSTRPPSVSSTCSGSDSKNDGTFPPAAHRGNSSSSQAVYSGAGAATQATCSSANATSTLPAAPVAAVAAASASTTVSRDPSKSLSSASMRIHHRPSINTTMTEHMEVVDPQWQRSASTNHKDPEAECETHSADETEGNSRQPRAIRIRWRRRSKISNRSKSENCGRIKSTPSPSNGDDKRSEATTAVANAPALGMARRGLQVCGRHVLSFHKS